MTIREYEKRLQQANPDLYIKTYGTGKAGIHIRGRLTRQRYIMRVPSGQITPYNHFQNRWGQASQFVTDLNPKGYYKLRQFVQRGRIECARVLYTQRLIKYADIMRLSK